MIENEDLRGKIVLGANELFLKYGIRSVTMDDIAGHLGMSKKTLYQAFRDKDEIVLAVTSEHLRKMSDEIEENVRCAKDDVEAMVGLSVCLRRNLRDMNPALLFDLHKYHHGSWEVWVRYKQEVIRTMLADQIKSGIANGYFRSEIDADILSVFRVEQIQMAFDPQIFPRGSYNFFEVQMQLFDHFVHGLLTRSGEELYQLYRQNINTEKTITS